MRPSRKLTQMAELQPRIDELENAVEEARQELARHKATWQKLSKERNEAAERSAQLRTAKSDAEAQKSQLSVQLTKIRGEPDKMKKQADLVSASVNNQQAEFERLTDSLSQLETELATQASHSSESIPRFRGLARSLPSNY